MFGSKKEKLQQEVAVLQEEKKKKEQILDEMYQVGDELEEQFARLAVTSVQIGRTIETLKEDAAQSSQIAEENLTLMQTLQEDVSEVLEQVQNNGQKQDAFFSEMKRQNAEIMEVVEQNKHFTTPMKYIVETPAFVLEENAQASEELEKMAQLSKSMGVLALNAAIEAGRMGDTGKKFIASAEEIRTLSEQFETAADQTGQRLKGMAEKMQEMEEQIRHLNQLLKENNISMGKVLKENTAQITDYEKAQTTVDGTVTKELEETSNLLQQKQIKLQELDQRVCTQISNVAEEFSKQQACSSEMEQTSKKLIGNCETSSQS